MATTLAIHGPLNGLPPALSAAYLKTRNSRPVVSFTQGDGYIFYGKMPQLYKGNGITVVLSISATATSGNVSFSAAVERIDAGNLDIDSDSFATAVNGSEVAVPGTSGQILSYSISLSGSEADSVAAGEDYRLKITRLTPGTSPAGGEAEILSVEIRQ